MARYEFSSVFADEIRNYISDRNAAGFDGEHARRSLIGFDRFCAAQGMEEPVFTTFHASRWLEQRESESHTTHYSRINASKQFLKYLSIKGYDVSVVRDVKYKGTDFIPIYIPMLKRKDISWQWTAIQADGTAGTRSSTLSCSESSTAAGHG